jgi:hypothetical protein
MEVESLTGILEFELDVAYFSFEKIRKELTLSKRIFKT